MKLEASPRIGLVEAVMSGNFPSSEFWPLTIYSTGRTMRINMGLSRFTKLRLSSDHGLGFSAKESPEESRIPSSAHLTWSFWRHHAQFSPKKRTLWIEHPWIEFRKSRGILAPLTRSGTVVFVSHSVPGVTPAIQEIDDLVKLVESQQFLEGPFTYCLHMHDVNLNLHQAFISRGLRVVTAGSSSSPFFVERLYRILAQHRSALSLTPGTQVLIAEEFGLESFILPLPNEPKLGRVNASALSRIDFNLVDRFLQAFSLSTSAHHLSRASKAEWLYLGLGTGAHRFDHLTEGLRPLPWSEVRRELSLD